MLFKNLNIFLKYCFKTKWVFKFPKKNKYLVFDGLYNPFSKIIKKKDITILYRRGEEINFRIFINCIIKFKFSTLDYCKEFIKHVSPKLILTAFDYYTIFYKLSENTGVKTIMFQKGQRGKLEEFYQNKKKYFPKNSKKKFFVDYVFLYNNKVKNFYSKRIRGNFFVTGSFENNFSKINFRKQKKEILFISNYNHKSNYKGKSENENIVALYLSKLAAQKKIRFNILPRYRGNNKILEKEIEFYRNTFKSNINFILQKNISSYEIILNYKFAFSTYSTLLLEYFAKGGRTGFIMFKSKQNPFFGYRFGAYQNLPLKGPFWSTFFKLDIKEISRVFKNVTESNSHKWKNQMKDYKKEIMEFDFNNKTFKKILQKHDKLN